MNELELTGLDGTNPLHVLAALGCLAITTDLDGEQAALGWRRKDGTFVPRILTPREPTEWADAVAACVREMARLAPSDEGPALRRRMEGLKKAEKDLVAELKKRRQVVRREAAARALRGAEKSEYERAQLGDLEARLNHTTKERASAEAQLSASLGFGPAHLGEIIGVPPEVLRLHARRALLEDLATARQLAGLASDGCIEQSGNVTPTPFSFSNGSSGKKLLKDFRRLASSVTGPMLLATLRDGEPAFADETALNWDPEDLRSYALQWSDPATAGARTDVACNALAYVGLGVTTCFPGKRGLDAVAFVRRNAGKGFTWPLWSTMLPLEVVRAVLASGSSPGFAGNPVTATARGILAVFRSEVVNPTGKRNFFAPASPVCEP